jgi:hypothetical protein
MVHRRHPKPQVRQTGKLGQATGGNHYIATVWGRGYMLRDPAAKGATRTRPRQPTGSLSPSGRTANCRHQWRRNPPRELSIDLVADERRGRVTGRAGAS